MQWTSCSSIFTCINICGLQSIQHYWSSKLLNMDNDMLSCERSRIPTNAFRKQLTSCSSMSTCINVCGLQSIQHFWSSKLLNIDNDTLSDEQSRIPTSAFRKQLTKCCSTLKCASTIKLLLQYVISSLLDYFWPIIYALSVQNKEFLQAPAGASGKQLTSASSMSTCINECGLQSI